RIARECFLELGPALSLIASAKQLDAEFRPRAPEPWLELHRSPLESDSIKIAAILHCKVGQRVKKSCRPGIHGQRPLRQGLDFNRFFVQLCSRRSLYRHCFY